METKTSAPALALRPIGAVRRTDDGVILEVDPAYRPALAQLEHFSHVWVLWWADRFDNEEGRSLLQMEPPYAPGYTTGVFASRSPLRPNPIGLTVCRLLSVDQDAGLVHVADLDVFSNTPLLDLKAYFPVCDRVQTAHIPAWLEGWPEWMPEDGLGLEPWDLEMEQAGF